MTNMILRALARLAGLAPLCALAAAMPLQDPAVPPPSGPDPKPKPEQEAPPKVEEDKPDILDSIGQGEPSEDELVALFARVETRLRDIDRMLYDASAGRPIEDAKESGIGELIQLAQSQSNSVLEDIDRILEIAQERAQQPQSSGGGSGQDPQQGESPLDQQQSSPSERESTPDSPANQKPEPQPHEPGEDGKPEGTEESEGDPENRAGKRPPDGATERAPAGTGNEAWGDLPIHVRELFRAQGGADLPPRYRDWIDSYYRRLNQKP